MTEASEYYTKTFSRSEWFNPSASHTKPITGKRYQGTNLDPDYIVELLTKEFGRIGKGWGYSIVEHGFETIPNLADQDETECILFWVQVSFWVESSVHCFDIMHSEKLTKLERNGQYTDEDAMLKCVTRCISKASAKLGLGGKIYQGEWTAEDAHKEPDPPTPKAIITAHFEARWAELEMEGPAPIGQIVTILNVYGVNAKSGADLAEKLDKAIAAIDAWTPPEKGEGLQLAYLHAEMQKAYGAEMTKDEQHAELHAVAKSLSGFASLRKVETRGQAVAIMTEIHLGHAQEKG